MAALGRPLTVCERKWSFLCIQHIWNAESRFWAHRTRKTWTYCSESRARQQRLLKDWSIFCIKERPTLSIQNVGKILPSWYCLLYNLYYFKYLDHVFANLPFYTILVILLPTVLLWQSNPPHCSSLCSSVLPLGREQCLFSAYSDSVWISCTAVMIRDTAVGTTKKQHGSICLLPEGIFLILLITGCFLESSHASYLDIFVFNNMGTTSSVSSFLHLIKFSWWQIGLINWKQCVLLW